MMRDLPSDVLSTIFKSALPTTFSQTDTLHHIRTKPPLNFSSVCRSWRQVALSQASLWSSFSIHFSDFPGVQRPLEPYIIGIVKKWLRNSRSAPLEISFYLDDYNGMDSTFGDLLQTILSAKRWKDVELSIVPPLHELLHTQHPCFVVKCPPSTLSLVLNEHWDDTYLDFPVATLDLSELSNSAGNHSQLRVLKVGTNVNCILPRPPSALALPDVQVLQCGCEISKSFHDLFGILNACPKLTKLKVNLPNTDLLWTISPMAKIVNLSHLRSLKIIETNYYGYAGTFVDTLLNHLSCPGLSKFRLHITNSFGVHPDADDLAIRTVRCPRRFRVLNAFLARSAGLSAPLVKIALVYEETSGDENVDVPVEKPSECLGILRDLLRPLLRLEELRLEGVPLDDHFVRDLSRTVSSVEATPESEPEERRIAIFPYLYDIHLGWTLGMRPNLPTASAIVDLIEMRCTHGRCSVCFNPSGIEELLPELKKNQRLKACIEEGAEVQVMHYEGGGGGGAWDFKPEMFVEEADE